jgi:ribosomal protein S27E
MNLTVAVAMVETYNRNVVAKTEERPKQGDLCPMCGEGTLTVSPSGQHLMCPKCGRVVMLCTTPPVPR